MTARQLNATYKLHKVFLHLHKLRGLSQNDLVLRLNCIICSFHSVNCYGLVAFEIIST